MTRPDRRRAMNLPIQRLGERARASYASHLSALPRDDVRLRFGAPLGREGIDAYVARIDFDTDAVFAAHDDRLEPRRRRARRHRRRHGRARRLGAAGPPWTRSRRRARRAGLDYARNRRIGRLWMHCLSENATMMRIARRGGHGDRRRHGRGRRVARACRRRMPASVANEFAADQVALFDYALKSQVASIARVADAVRRAS